MAPWLKAVSWLIPKRPFQNSALYWERRYRRGGNSGAGSYDKLAMFKGEVINNFIRDNNIRKAIELGCGDGHQLSFFKLEEYVGYDVSPTAISLCRKAFSNDPSKSFHLMAELDPDLQAELTLSLDVIYHLVEEEVFTSYMDLLFGCSSRFVIIYSTHFQEPYVQHSHERHRRFSDWIQDNQPDFSLLEFIPNRFPYDGDGTKTSMSDFYIYKRSNK